MGTLEQSCGNLGRTLWGKVVNDVVGTLGALWGKVVGTLPCKKVVGTL